MILTRMTLPHHRRRRLAAAAAATICHSLLAISIFFFFFFLCCNNDKAVEAGFIGGGGKPKIPKSTNERDNQAIESIKRAISSPKVPPYPLIECEFPPLTQLNKQGDGSLQSMKQVDEANLQFCQKLIKALSPPLPFLGPVPWLFTSTSATNAFYDRAKAMKSNINVHSLKEPSLPKSLMGRDPCVIVSPSGASRDYQNAKRLVEERGNTVILVNGLAKDVKSVSSEATMAYYCKPLTYGSQIAGYLLRAYPSDWAVLSANPASPILGTYKDEDILVPGTNTPDLRGSVRLVQEQQ